MMDNVLFFYILKLESYIVPNVWTELKNKSQMMGILEWADVGHIIPPNLYAKTRLENESDTPAKYQSSAHIVVKI